MWLAVGSVFSNFLISPSLPELQHSLYHCPEIYQVTVISIYNLLTEILYFYKIVFLFSLLGKGVKYICCREVVGIIWNFAPIQYLLNRKIPIHCVPLQYKFSDYLPDMLSVCFDEGLLNPYILKYMTCCSRKLWNYWRAWQLLRESKILKK